VINGSERSKKIRNKNEHHWYNSSSKNKLGQMDTFQTIMTI